MFENAVRMFVVALKAYAAAGLVFALAFVSFGVSRVDEQARGGPVGFRLVLLPGSIALWPLLAYRWLSGIREAPIERNPHRDIAK